MIKKILLITVLFGILASCSTPTQNESDKSNNASQRSGRINSSESNTKDIFKDLE